MKKCTICGREITDKRQMVTIKTGKLLRRKVKHFHLDCFFADKIKARDTAVAMIKS